MQETNLTDEELVKALECCSKSWDCDNCKRDKENNNRFICSENLLKDCLDLIRRLQYGYSSASKASEEWKAKYEAERKENAEQKAEIERLTEFEQRYLEESKERCKFEQLYEKIRHDHNIGLGIQRNHWEKKVKQAVKETAKEIYELIDAVKEVFPNDYRGYDMAHGWSMCVDKLKEIVKSKGVEVE